MSIPFSDPDFPADSAHQEVRNYKTLAASAPLTGIPDCALNGITDDTVAFQARLDLLESFGGGTLQIDGAAATTGLVQPANVTIDGMGTGSLIALPGSGKPVIRNKSIRASATANEADPWSTIVDANISLRRIKIDGNRRGGASGSSNPRTNSAGVWIGGLEYFGVRELLLEDVTVHDACSFGIWAANLDKSKFIRCTVTVPQANIDGATVSETTNQDGIHINGAARDIFIKDADMMTADDSIAFNADDGHQGSSQLGIFGSKVSHGPILRATVEGLYLRGALTGPRILSAISPVDDIVIRRVRGGYRWYAFLVSNFDSSIGTGGVVGTVTLDDWALSGSDAVPYPTNSVLVVDRPLNRLVLLKHVKADDGNGKRYLRLIDGANIESLEVNGFTQTGGADTSQIQVDFGATVQRMLHRKKNRLRLSDGAFGSDKSEYKAAFVASSGTIGVEIDEIDQNTAGAD